jgi:hypothetical protein
VDTQKRQLTDTAKRQLSLSIRSFLAPPTLERRLGYIPFACRKGRDALIKNKGANGSMVVCGHTHVRFDRMIGTTRVVNAGTVGMPFGEHGADWLLLGNDAQLRHTNYDASTAADRMRGTVRTPRSLSRTFFSSRQLLKCLTSSHASRCSMPPGRPVVDRSRSTP